MIYLQKSLLWIAALAVYLLVAGSVTDIPLTRTVLIMIGACFICELVDSGLGMGYGTTLTPILLLLGYQPSDIVPTILLSELLSGFTAAFFHNEIKNVDFHLKGRDLKPASLLAGASMVGVSLGVAISLSLPQEALKVSIGSIIFLSGFFVVLLSNQLIRYRTWKMLALASVASFNKAVSGGGYGPLVTSGQILSGVQGRAAVGITSFAEAFTCLAAVMLYLLQGGYINLSVFIPMSFGALMSVPFSVFAVNKSNDDHLKIIIGLLTMLMGSLTVAKTLMQ